MADSVNDTSSHSAANPEQVGELLLNWIKSRELNKKIKFERVLIAFSGGADSTALVLAASQIQKQLSVPILAIYVNHQIHQDSDRWQDHCQNVCADLQLPFQALQASLADSSRRGLEALAREARYAALAGVAGNNDLLLTGQHADDQAETLLLHLLRGSGVDGLAAIHSLRPWNNSWLGRPFLNYRKTQLVEYIRHLNKGWLEDPSNQELQHRRNYLRHRVIPVLNEQWPQVVAQLNKTANHCQESQKNLIDLANIDLLKLQLTKQDKQLQRLPIAEFSQLPSRRQRLLLRSWIRQQGWLSPGKLKLADFLSQIKSASSVTNSELRWLQHRMAVHGSHIYLEASYNTSEDNSIYPFDNFPNNWGELGFSPEIDDSKEKYQVSTRSGGEAIKLAGRNGSQSLKNLFQQAKIPIWLRNSIPLLWQQGQLLAVGDIWLDEDFAKDIQQSGRELSWVPAQKPWQVFRDVIISERNK